MPNNVPNLEVSTHISGNGILYFLEGTINVENWNDFQNRQGDYATPAPDTPNNGVYRLNIAADSNNPYPEPSPAQVKAYWHTLENATILQEKILTALISEYKNIQELFDYEDLDGNIMPDVHHSNEFKKLIGLHCIHITEEVSNGVAYVGYEFGCMWDGEHGLGVMTHKDKILEIGQADTAF